MARAGGVLVAAAVLAALFTAPVRADTASQLRQAQARLSSLLAKISSESKTVTRLEGEAYQLKQQFNVVENQIGRTQVRIVQVQQTMRLARRQANAAQDTLNHRAWVAYENGPGTSLEFLLSSSSLSDLTDRMEIVNRAAQIDVSLIGQIAQWQEVLAKKQSQLQTLQFTLERQRSELSRRQGVLNGKLLQAKSVVDQLNRDRTAAERQIRQLKIQRQREIEAARLAALAAIRSFQPSGVRLVLGGVFQVCPVDQPRSFTDDFGAPRPGHLHQGDDISAPSGTPIRAPFPGNAVASSDALGGNDVYVYGGLGFVFNAHLSAYGTLGQVGAGTVIGYVGATGDATGPHDHFEWHPNAIPANPYVSPYGYAVINGAIDPTPYLNAVC